VAEARERAVAQRAVQDLAERNHESPSRGVVMAGESERMFRLRAGCLGRLASDDECGQQNSNRG